jgi:hypothetical protein
MTTPTSSANRRCENALAQICLLDWFGEVALGNAASVQQYLEASLSNELTFEV